jgi:hypothetical protein
MLKCEKKLLHLLVDSSSILPVNFVRLTRSVLLTECTNNGSVTVVMKHTFTCFMKAVVPITLNHCY